MSVVLEVILGKNFGTKNIKKRCRFISNQYFFLFSKSIYSFDPLKIGSDRSNISQILCLVRKFDKNTPWISKEILLRPFYNFTQRGVFYY